MTEPGPPPDEPSEEFAQDPYVAEYDAPPTPEQQQSADSRRRAIVILSVVVTIALVGAGIAAVALVHKSKPATAATSTASVSPTDPAGNPPPTAVLNAVSSVPASTLATVGRGTSAVSVKPISGKPIVTAGKPTVLYVGALFCPYCAAERWSIYQSLSRFGTFTGVVTTRSSEDNLATLDFAHATYSSTYVTFDPIELEGENREPLEKLTPEQNTLFTKYAQDAFPFLYFNGKYAQAGAGYDPAILAGLSQPEIATLLGDPKNPVTQGILGEANVLTAATCGITNDQPSAVCGTPTVSGLEDTINGTQQS